MLLFAMAFTFNLIAATQDIATDGLAVRMLDARELGHRQRHSGRRVSRRDDVRRRSAAEGLRSHRLDRDVRRHGGVDRAHDDSGARDARAVCCRKRSASADDAALVRLAAAPADAGRIAAGGPDLLLPLRRSAADDAARAVPDRSRSRLVRHRAPEGMGGQRDEHRRRAAGRLAGFQHHSTQRVAHQRRGASGVVHFVRGDRSRCRRCRPAVGRDDRRRNAWHDGNRRTVRADDGRIGSRARRH